MTHTMKELVEQLHSILSAKNSWQKRKRKLTTELLTLILMSKFRVGRVGEVVDILSELSLTMPQTAPVSVLLPFPLPYGVFL